MKASELALLEGTYVGLCERVGLVPTWNGSDLEYLDVMLGRSTISVARPADALAVGIALGIVLSSELELGWISAAFDGNVIGIENRDHREFALKRRHHPCFVFPISMVAKKIVAGELDLTLLRLFDYVREQIRADGEYRVLAEAEGEPAGGMLIS